MILLRLDENVSHKIADAAKMLGILKGVSFETPPSTSESGLKDVPWIERFAKRGKRGTVRIVFSGDGQMRNTEPERVALEDAGIIVFFAPGKHYWRGLRRGGQAAYLFRWLPAMIEMAKSASPGTQFKLPGSFAVRQDLKPLPSVRKRRAPGRPRPRKRAATPLLDPKP